MLAVLSACMMAQAQSPRAVLKAILSGEDHASVAQKYEKAVEKHDFGEPAMILANDMMLHSEGQSVFAYTNYCAHREEIENDEDVLKMVKALKTSLNELFNQIESVSAIKVMEEDSESAYDKYILIAERNGHPMLTALKTAREKRAFADVTAADTIPEYDRFLAKYAEGAQARIDSVISRRTDLVFDTVMVSGNEQASVDFISSFPEYGRIAEVETHLSDIRFAAVVASGEAEGLRNFLGMYPGYPEIDKVVTMLSEIDFASLDRKDMAAVAAYVQTYPQSVHTPGLNEILAHEKMIETADLAAIFAYVREHGYDFDFSRMIRAVARIHGKAIVTPDIREVDMVRFIDASGKVGYWNLGGEVAVEPVFEVFTPQGDYPYDVVHGVEFLKGRNAAAVCNAGLVGAVNSQGEMVVPLNGLGIVMEDRITLLVRKTGGGSYPEYATEVYDFTGAPVTMGTYVKSREVPACDRRGEFDPGVSFEFRNGRINSKVNVCLESTGFYRYIVNHDGSTLNQKVSSFQAYSEDFIVTERGLTNVGNWIVAGPDPYDDHHFIKDGRILVRKNGKYGYLDENMAVAIPMQYDSAEDFCGPTALVDGNRLIDRDGNLVFEALSIVPLKTLLPEQKWAHYMLYSFKREGSEGIVDSAGCVFCEGTMPSSDTGLVELLSMQ